MASDILIIDMPSPSLCAGCLFRQTPRILFSLRPLHDG